MQPITYKIAMQIAKEALDDARSAPQQYFLMRLHNEVNLALMDRGYSSATVTSMDGLSTHSVKGVASEVYNATRHARKDA